MFFLKNRCLAFNIALIAVYFFIFGGVSCAATGIEKSMKYYDKGMLLYEKGKYKAAEKQLEKAIDFSEKAKEAHYKKGLIYYERGNYQEAEREFQKAIKAAKKENDQHYKRGLILYNQGRFQEAEEEFQKAIAAITKDGRIEQLKEKESINGKKKLEYTIAKGDSLIIKIWQNPDLDDEVIVRPDGMISFPLVGDIQAEGLSISELKERLTARLREFLKYPQVSVSVKEIAGEKVIVLGEVNNPGVYLVTGNKTILEAISLAGGFTEHGVVSSVMLIKGGFKNPKPMRLNLTKALKRANTTDNLVLESEDMVYVPRRFIRDVNYFLRQFLDPVYQGFFIHRELEDL